MLVFYRARLYADVLLHLFYVAMNGYGWWYWSSGGAERRRSQADSELPIAYTPVAAWPPLLALTALGVGTLGWLLSSYTDADLAYWD
ncbi:unnamed protein product, partial [marine sediment metagenome]